MWDLFSDPYLGSLIVGPLFTLALIFLVMAKSSAASQVAERRLRPIYDWLDTGNNKKALQEADKVLKKQPDFQCCKVLKCLALIRLGKEGEAETILNKVRDYKTLTIQMFTFASTYRSWMKFRWMKGRCKR